jgi:hypothetical protein
MVCCDKVSLFPFLHLLDIQPKFKLGLSHINGLLWQIFIVYFPSNNPSVTKPGITNTQPGGVHTRKFTTCKICSTLVKTWPSGTSGSLETHQEDSPILHDDFFMVIDGNKLTNDFSGSECIKKHNPSNRNRLLSNNVTTPLLIYHQNIRGLRNKIEELFILFSDNLPHILCFTEHHLFNDEINSLHINPYNIGTSYCRANHN